jgi:pyruvate,orthophosphate dikinase
MIELPRAAVSADRIAEEAEFFSFGTNDLTQMTFGFPAMTLQNICRHILTRRFWRTTRLSALTFSAQAVW